MSNGRGLGGKRVVRFSVSVSNDYDSKLKKLAISCDQSRAEMANMILEIGLSSPELVEKLQDRYNKNPTYKVKPIRINSELYYS
jgi:hypothetical protein